MRIEREMPAADRELPYIGLRLRSIFLEQIRELFQREHRQRLCLRSTRESTSQARTARAVE